MLQIRTEAEILQTQKLSTVRIVSWASSSIVALYVVPIREKSWAKKLLSKILYSNFTKNFMPRTASLFALYLSSSYSAAVLTTGIEKSELSFEVAALNFDSAELQADLQKHTEEKATHSALRNLH